MKLLWWSLTIYGYWTYLKWNLEERDIHMHFDSVRLFRWWLMAIQFEKTCRWLCTHSIRDNFVSQPVKNVIIFLCCIYLKKNLLFGNNLFIVGNVVWPNVSLRYCPESLRSSCYVSPHFISCWSAITKTLAKNYLSDSLTLIAKDHGDQP